MSLTGFFTRNHTLRFYIFACVWARPLQLHRYSWEFSEVVCKVQWLACAQRSSSLLMVSTIPHAWLSFVPSPLFANLVSKGDLSLLNEVIFVLALPSEDPNGTNQDWKVVVVGNPFHESPCEERKRATQRWQFNGEARVAWKQPFKDNHCILCSYVDCWGVPLGCVEPPLSDVEWGRPPTSPSYIF